MRWLFWRIVQCAAFAVCQGRAERVLLRKMAKPPLTGSRGKTLSRPPSHAVVWRCPTASDLNIRSTEHFFVEQMSAPCSRGKEDGEAKTGRVPSGHREDSGVRGSDAPQYRITRGKSNTAPSRDMRTHIGVYCVWARTLRERCAWAYHARAPTHII